VNKSAFFVVSNQRERKSEKIDDADVQKKKEKEKRERDRALRRSARRAREPIKKRALSRTFSAFRDVWVVFRHYSFFKYGSKVVPAFVYKREREMHFVVSSYQRSIFSLKERV
jgi:hypothetical protein